MFARSRRADPWEMRTPVGSLHDKPKSCCCATERRPRSRVCLRKGCKRRYHPGQWNQRYCQDAECLREVRRWPAAGQASPGRNGQGTARRGSTRAPSTGQVRAANGEGATGCGGAWSRSKSFFSNSLCARPGCYEPPATSIRNPARYCCATCRQAVRNVLDRERKWRSRGTSAGQAKRACEYEAARQERSRRRRDGSGSAASRAPPQ